MNVLVIVSSNAVWAWTVACLFIGGTLAHYGGQFLAWTDRRRQPADPDPERNGATADYYTLYDESRLSAFGAAFKPGDPRLDKLLDALHDAQPPPPPRYAPGGIVTPRRNGLSEHRAFLEDLRMCGHDNEISGTTQPEEKHDDR